MCDSLVMIGYELREILCLQCYKKILSLDFSCSIFFSCFQIVLFQFGLGANAHYVILELYAQGNIILTDSEFMVMTLLRSHRYATQSICVISSASFFFFSPGVICKASFKLLGALAN